MKINKTTTISEVDGKKIKSIENITYTFNTKDILDAVNTYFKLNIEKYNYCTSFSDGRANILGLHFMVEK